MSNNFKQIKDKKELIKAMKNDNVYIKLPHKDKPNEYRKTTNYKRANSPEEYLEENRIILLILNGGDYYKKV